MRELEMINKEMRKLEKKNRNSSEKAVLDRKRIERKMVQLEARKRFLIAAANPAKKEAA